MSRARGQFTTLFQTTQPADGAGQDFALVLNVPAEISQALDDVRRRYDPAFKAGLAPHITVKRPASVGDPRKVELMRIALRPVAAHFPVIEVQLQGYGIFKNPGRNVVFLKIQDEQPLRELHRRVIEALTQVYPDGGQADQFEGERYHPHVTIGNELSDLDLVVLEHELATGGYRLDFAFRLATVDLFVHEAGLAWKTIETLRFAGKTDAPA